MVTKNMSKSKGMSDKATLEFVLSVHVLAHEAMNFMVQ